MPDTAATITTQLVPTQRTVTLGILAGGAASRLGGRDKAWLERDGTPQVLHLVDALRTQSPSRTRSDIDAVMVSANRNAERYMTHGLRAIHDRVTGIGPLGGLDALAAECRSEWLLTAPVDAVAIPVDLLASLSSAESGAYAVDDDGPQPLLALWRVDALRTASAAAIEAGEHAVHALQAALRMTPRLFGGMRIGNLNTPRDLVAAGIDPP